MRPRTAVELTVMPARTTGGDDVNAEPGPPAEPAEESGVAAPVPAEAEAPADDDLPGPELVPQDPVDEGRAVQAGEGPAEGNDDDGVDAGPARAGPAAARACRS